MVPILNLPASFGVISYRGHFLRPLPPFALYIYIDRVVRPKIYSGSQTKIRLYSGSQRLEPKDSAQETLVGRSLLYCWPSVGWCVGLIKEANGDRRFKIKGEVVNFFIH